VSKNLTLFVRDPSPENDRNILAELFAANQAVDAASDQIKLANEKVTSAKTRLDEAQSEKRSKEARRDQILTEINTYVPRRTAQQQADDHARELGTALQEGGSTFTMPTLGDPNAPKGQDGDTEPKPGDDENKGKGEGDGA
jgi:hypothetical protein